ncbi:MAG TPA: SUMF1/EgtB/PvdO family nonheme iron enzyme [Desulfobacterales bacterium]|nr:SUMF1/EgtB/PvdO family nonheme iron enzyme [Desulfobacterales bacterium]
MPEKKTSDTNAAEPIIVTPVAFRSGRRGGSGRLRRMAAWFAVLAAVALLLALAGTLWFVVTARQVSIHLDPAPDTLSLSGGWITPRIGDHYLLQPGSYALHAELACQRDIAHRFEVGADERQEIRLAFQKLPGRLRIQAHPDGRPGEAIPGAEVFIDGRSAGAVAIEPLEAAPGRRRIEIRGERYQPAVTDVEVEGCDRLQEIALALTPNWSGVHFSSIPAAAAVKVDGRPLGRTPVELELAAGAHDIEISAERYKTWRGRVEVVAGQPVALPEVRLEPADGRLAIRSRPAGASVLVDGRYVGQTPVEVDVGPGKEHEIQLSMTGYERANQKVAVAGGEVKGLDLLLTAQEGVVHFKVDPADAELFVNGTGRGKVPVELRLPAVEHDIEIRKEGLEPFRTRVLPRPGFPQELKVALRRGEPAPVSGTAGLARAPNGYELKRVAPGTFAMGSSRREQGRRSNETLKQVRLTRSFYLGTREVTNGEFRQFLATHTSGTFKSQDLNRDDLPVVMVSWEQAALFCNWLSVKASLPPVYIQKEGRVVASDPLGKGYRLPTEAEWEYSARLGVSGKYPWGEGYPPAPGAGNYADESAKGLIDVTIDGYNDGYPAAAEVGKFRPAATGLFDMGGNVAEWCHDYYAIETAGEKEQSDPVGPREGAHRVVKGGSWKSAGIAPLRIAFRDYSAGPRNDLGFRICQYAE